MYRLIQLWAFCLCCGGLTNLQAQTTPPNFNVTPVGQLTYPQELRDVWGYVDGTGVEYALVSTQTGVSVVSLADPTQPVEVFFAPDATSTHRDLKTWGDHAYVTTEQGTGVMIIDLSPLPQGTPTYRIEALQATSNPTSNVPLRTAHNLFIDANGYCYISGSDRNRGGVVIFDVFTDPDTPRYVGQTMPQYSHDAYVRGDTLWSSDIFDGVFTVYDVSDPTNPQRLADQSTPFNFTHNAWLSDDGQTLFAVDEKANAWLAAYDVSDLSNIRELDRYKTPTPNTIPHNTHTYNDYQVISYYTDGLIILDNSRPDNLIEVARYDTYNGTPATGFKGAWGAYPYLPSGLILITDINTGLHVLQPNYQRGCWLEGLVTDQSSGSAIFGATVELLTTTTTEESKLDGEYKTGIGLAGTYQVRYSKVGYLSQTITLSLQHGVVTTQNVQLVPAIPYTLTGQVVDQGTTTGIPQAEVWLKSHLYEYRTTANASGQFSLTIYPDNQYQLVAGQWGHKEGVFMVAALDSATAQGNTYPLERGYKDDFVFDYGWTENGNAVRGRWEYAIPELLSVAPLEGDLAQDIGDGCLITGNGVNGSVTAGYTRMVSPIMDLSGAGNPFVHFHYFFWAIPPGGEDSIAVYMTNGTDTAFLWSNKNSINNRQWSPKQSIRIQDYISLSSTMQLYFQANDEGSYNAVEALVDAFEIVDSASIDVSRLSAPTVQLHAYPNPFQATLQVEYAWQQSPATLPPLVVYNLLGQVVEMRRLSAPQGQLQLGATWQAGVYVVQIGTQTCTVVKQR